MALKKANILDFTDIFLWYTLEFVSIQADSLRNEHDFQKGDSTLLYGQINIITLHLQAESYDIFQL